VSRVDGRLVLDDEKADGVRRVFQLARAGMGPYAIARKLNGERVPVPARQKFDGRPAVWTIAGVYSLLTDRAVLGEFDPHERPGEPARARVGPIAGYRPRVIEQDEFDAVQGRPRPWVRCGRDRTWKRIHLFTGLLRDAHGGRLTYRSAGRDGQTAIAQGRGGRGRGTPWSCFAAAPFDKGLYSQLIEVKESDLVAKEGDQKSEAVTTARQEGANPLAESWKEFRATADTATEDLSGALGKKIRAALRQSLERVTCLFTGRGVIRFAAVRVDFRSGGRHLEYVLSYKRSGTNASVQPPGTVYVLTFPDVALPSGLDLRKPAGAAAIEESLATIDLTSLGW
jgi:hypothetical protein